MRTADKPMKRKEYEKSLRTLQVELCLLQDWVKKKASSTEFVGEFWLGKYAECVI